MLVHGRVVFLAQNFANKLFTTVHSLFETIYATAQEYLWSAWYSDIG